MTTSAVLNMVLEKLASPDVAIRRNAVAALGAIEGDEALRNLYRLTRDKDLSLRRAASDALFRRQGDKSFLARLAHAFLVRSVEREDEEPLWRRLSRGLLVGLIVTLIYWAFLSVGVVTDAFAKGDHRILLLAFVIASGGCAASVARSIHRYPNRSAGMIAEAVSLLGPGLAMGGLIAFFLWSMSPPNSLTIAYIVALPLGLAMGRVFAALAVPQAGGGLMRAILAGGVAAGAMFFALSTTLTAAWIYQLALAGVPDPNHANLYALTALCAFPASIAAGIAYAQEDLRREEVHGVVGAIKRTRMDWAILGAKAFVFALACAPIVAFASSLGVEGFNRHRPQTAVFEQPLDVQIYENQLGRFSLAYPGRVRIGLGPSASTSSNTGYLYLGLERARIRNLRGLNFPVTPEGAFTRLLAKESVGSGSTNRGAGSLFQLEQVLWLPAGDYVVCVRLSSTSSTSDVCKMDREQLSEQSQDNLYDLATAPLDPALVFAADCRRLRAGIGIGRTRRLS